MTRNFHPSIAICALVIAAATLGGCAKDKVFGDETASMTPYSGSQAHEISVVKGPVTLQVDASHGTLQPTQINAVMGFANQAMAAGLTPIAIARPNGGGGSAQVASEVAALMVQQGLPRQMISISTYPAPSTAPIEVSYVSTYAKTDECGLWPEDLSSTAANKHYENFGCAVQANIAAQIANPKTIIVPRPASPAYARNRYIGSTILTLTKPTGAP
jgi:pilus assembly protein CpaD